MEELVKKCGDYLLHGLENNDFARVATFQLTLEDYVLHGEKQFSSKLTVYVMRYISNVSDAPNQRNIKIVVNVQLIDGLVCLQFQWLSKSLKTIIKKTTPGLVELCWICETNKPAIDFKRCGKCRDASYCSVACQRKAWPEHKKHCVT